MFEMFQLPFIVQAFEIALITGLLLAYMGVHVVGRGIVFVDLALGQISSLGVAFGAAIGSENQYIPIVFTLIGALLLSFIKIRDKRLKQEAIIGIVYALASAITVMLISKTAHGDTEIQDVLFGSILSVTTDQIKTIAIIFGIITLLHVIFFRKLFSLTEQYENGAEHSSLFNFWNFFFYISLGLAIVYAVKVNGVIPVFSFLIIPAVSGIMLTHSKAGMIVTALVVSFLGCFMGLNVSYHYDFPAGSSIVAVLGGIFFIAAFISWLRSKLFRKRAAIE
jgi:zinc/manganese transport system permease protein